VTTADQSSTAFAESSAGFGTEFVESADGLEVPENLSVWLVERRRSDA
jgi:hypothetical protein